MPREVFVAGQVLTAAELNIVSDASVMVFDDASARTAAISSPSEGMVTYLKDTDQLEKYTTDWVAANTSFTASTTITATDATWSVPTLGAPIVKVTAIGGGGAGNGSDGSSPIAGNSGGTTTFDASTAGTVTAAGGTGAGTGSKSAVDPAGFRAGNGGLCDSQNATAPSVSPGLGGAITVAYLDLSGISTVDVTIGAGGTSSSGGGPGGRGEVVVEYVAG